MSLSPADFSSFALQGSGWFGSRQPTSRDLLRLVVVEWADLFDGDPSSFPVGDQAPPEITRFFVGSRNGQWRIQASLQRVDVFCQSLRVGSPNEGQDVPSQFSRVFTTLLSAISELRIGRLAYISNKIKFDDQPARTLSKFFCRDEILKGPLNRPENFELHAHKVYAAPNFPKMNSWVRWRTGFYGPPAVPGGKPIIALEQDLNTLAEATAQSSYTADQIDSFFRTTPNEVNQILDVYLLRSKASKASPQ